MKKTKKEKIDKKKENSTGKKSFNYLEKYGEESESKIDYRSLGDKNQNYNYKNIEKNTLKNLYDKTRITLPKDKRVNLIYEPGKIELILDTKKGFRGYEDFSIKNQEDLFNFKYMSLKENALETFSSNSNYFNLIKDSKLFSRFLEETENLQTSNRDYRELILLRTEGNFQEVEVFLDFFSKTFFSKLNL